MERMQGEAQNAYTVAVAATEKFCEQNNVIMKITESFPFVVHFTVDAPLTLLEANSGELIAPQIIVTVEIDSTVKSRADKAIETSLLKKLIKNAEGLAHLFFCRTAESVYEGVTVTTSQMTEAQRAELEEQIRQAQEAERWQDLIVFAFDKTAELCGILGAPVESVRYEDGIVWIRREKEAIRLPDVTIRDEADLRRACIKIIGSVCKA